MSSLGASRLAWPSEQDASGHLLGVEEQDALREVIESGVLNSTRGRATRSFEESFAHLLGVRHAYACSSGTAAVHTALAALDLEPGDEVICSPLTDFGGVGPILWQCCVPVFADTNARTGCLTAETIVERMSPRTRAVIVTHLFGHPTEMAAIVDVCAARGIPVIEDCAQAYLAADRGQLVGTMGAIGCFSLQQTKHITTGEGGVVVTNDHALAERMHGFINKARNYSDPVNDHHFLAMNYRMTELQGAVARVQLPKLPGAIVRRRALAERALRALEEAPSISAGCTVPTDCHAFWKLALLVTGARLSPVDLAAVLARQGIPSMPKYQAPAFRWTVFRTRKTFGKSEFPFTLASPQAMDWRPERFTGMQAFLDRILVLPWPDQLTEAQVDHLCNLLVEASLDAQRDSPAEHCP